MPRPRKRAPTSTSEFGVSRRESHDASGFYARFTPPEVSSDDSVVQHVPAEPLVVGDARDMSELKDRSVALVVTSPPYFAGKAYEAELEAEGVPSSYVEYLDLLRDVFAECKRVLEPGGRIAVNVANLGRKPYRSLSADVIRILQDDLGLLLRGEVVWLKARGAGGNCAWGSYLSPQNPVLRDVTERVVIASKGRFDRARTPAERGRAGLPHQVTITGDEFLDGTLDLWELPTESARRVEHPAPFPVALPQRLIELYTFAGDLVLDPFLGSGSTAVAAARTGRRYAGYDLDPGYVAIARRRVEAEHADFEARAVAPDAHARAAADARARRQGMKGLVKQVLLEAGFTDLRENTTVLGLTVPFTALDREGQRWWFDLTGGFGVAPSGLQRTDATVTALGRAAVVSAAVDDRVVLFAPRLPPARSPLSKALRAGGRATVFDVLEVLDPDSRQRLAAYATGAVTEPRPGFWTAADLEPS